MRQAVDEPLQSVLCVGGQGSVDGKEHLSQQELAHLCFSSLAGQVEQLAVSRVWRNIPSSDSLKA